MMLVRWRGEAKGVVDLAYDLVFLAFGEKTSLMCWWLGVPGSRPGIFKTGIQNRRFSHSPG